MFFKEKGINIDETNYSKLLANQKRFEKQYGLTKRELLERYPYEEGQYAGNKPKEEKSTQDLGKETQEEQEDVEGKEKVAKRLSDRAQEIDKTKEE